MSTFWSVVIVVAIIAFGIQGVRYFSALKKRNEAKIKLDEDRKSL